MIDRFTHIALRVADIDRSLVFYRDLLGFVETSRYKGKGGPSAMMLGDPDASIEAVFLKRDGTTIELQTLEGDDPTASEGVRRGLSHIGFKVSDLASVLERLTSGGATVIESSRWLDSGLGSEVLFVTDPDGTRIELVAVPAEFDLWDRGI